MNVHLRVARPVSNLTRSAAMDAQGLSLSELGRFEEWRHDGGILPAGPGRSTGRILGTSI